MSVISDLTAGAASGLFTGLGGLATSIRTAITGKSVLSSEDQLKLATQLQQLEQQALAGDQAMAAAQAQIDNTEAASTSFFKSGWRPAVGWICVSGLGYQFLLMPVLPWAVHVCGGIVDPLPGLDIGTLMTLLMGMLGLGGMRTFEKVKGVD